MYTSTKLHKPKRKKHRYRLGRVGDTKNKVITSCISRSYFIENTTNTTKESLRYAQWYMQI